MMRKKALILMNKARMKEERKRAANFHESFQNKAVTTLNARFSLILTFVN